jgi:hypothetical protein
MSLMDILPSGQAPAGGPAPQAPSEPAPQRPAAAAADPAQQLHQLVQLGLDVAIRDGRVSVIRETGEKIEVSDIQAAALALPAGAAPSTAPAAATEPTVRGERLSYSLKCTVHADIPAPPPAPGTQSSDKNAADPAPSRLDLKMDTAGSVGPSAKGLAIDHTTTLRDVFMKRGTQELRPGQTSIRAHALFDQNAKSLLLNEAGIDSDFLRLQVAGSVKDYDTLARADLTGGFWADGQSITQQVRTLTGKQDFNLVTDKRKQYTFHVTGPLRQPQRWQTDGLGGQMQVGWQAFSAGPIQAGELDLVLQFQGDRINIKPSSLALNKGLVNLAGTIVLTDPQHPDKISPVLYLKDYTAVVDKVALDQTVSTEVVSHINPAAFYRPEAISGTTTVHLQDVEMPLSAAALKRGRISKGRIDFADLNIQPRRDDVMATLLNLLGGSGAGVGKVEIPGADFRMADGRIYYDDFVIKWGSLYDIKFSGSVGLDGSVDLVAGLPVTPGLIRTLIELPPLPGAAEKVVQGLGQTYIPVRIHGSRSNMQMDKAGLTSALKQAMQNLLKSPQGAVEGLEGILQGALGGHGNPLGQILSGQAAPSSNPAGAGATSSESLRDALEGAISPLLRSPQEPKPPAPPKPKAQPKPIPSPPSPAPERVEPSAEQAPAAAPVVPANTLRRFAPGAASQPSLVPISPPARGRAALPHATSKPAADKSAPASRPAEVAPPASAPAPRGRAAAPR